MSGLVTPETQQTIISQHLQTDMPFNGKPTSTVLLKTSTANFSLILPHLSVLSDQLKNKCTDVNAARDRNKCVKQPALIPGM